MANGDDFIEETLVNYEADTRDGEMTIKALMHLSSRMSKLPCAQHAKNIENISKRNMVYVIMGIVGFVSLTVGIIASLYTMFKGG